jgi:hypothetical protein
MLMLTLCTSSTRPIKLRLITSVSDLYSSPIASKLGLFIAFRYAFIWENKKKQRRLANGDFAQQSINATAFADLTDKQNPK